MSAKEACAAQKPGCSKPFKSQTATRGGALASAKLLDIAPCKLAGRERTDPGATGSAVQLQERQGVGILRNSSALVCNKAIEEEVAGSCGGELREAALLELVSSDEAHMEE